MKVREIKTANRRNNEQTAEQRKRRKTKEERRKKKDGIHTKLKKFRKNFFTMENRNLFSYHVDVDVEKEQDRRAKYRLDT